MPGQTPRALGAAFVFVLALGASALAQGRNWVDPPSSTPAPTPAPAAKPDAPPATEARRAAEPAARAPQKAERAASVRRAQATKRTVTETVRSRTRPVASARTAAPSRAAAVRPRGERLAARPAPSRGIRTVGDALQAGYVAMRLRTIEYPDGRRESMLLEPDSDTMRSLRSGPLSRRPVALGRR
jgi:hypothetical protein